MGLLKRVELLRDNMLVGTHVYRKGDVVEVDQVTAQTWVKIGVAIDAGERPLTEAGRPRLRSEVIAENALAADPPAAERAVRQPANPKSSR
jgi:hypothetical protein